MPHGTWREGQARLYHGNQCARERRAQAGDYQNPRRRGDQVRQDRRARMEIGDSPADERQTYADAQEQEAAARRAIWKS